MYVGTKIQKKVEEVIQQMIADGVQIMEFEYDTMPFLVVKDGAEEAKKLLQAGKTNIIPAIDYNSQNYLVFNL